MKKLFLLMTMVMTMLFSVVNVAPVQAAGNTVQVYIESKDSIPNFKQKDYAFITEQVKPAFPAGYNVVADSQFFTNVDLYREDNFKPISDADRLRGVTPQPIQKEDWVKICNSANADYVLVIRLDRANQKANFGFGPFGGGSTAEVVATTRLFSKAKGDYTYSNRQMATGKIKGDFPLDVVAKFTLPQIMPNIKLTAANF